MNKMFIIIGIPLAMLLSSCSTYKAVLYPCDFNKYKCFRTEFSKYKEVKQEPDNPEKTKAFDRSFGYKGDVKDYAGRGASYFRLTRNASNRDDTLILTVDTTNGVIIPPHRGMLWTFSFAWDWPPKTVTIIATDSITNEKLFEIYYSRYMFSMDSGRYYDRIQSAVEYCIKELKKSPPKVPLEITIPTSSLSEVTRRIYGED